MVQEPLLALAFTATYKENHITIWTPLVPGDILCGEARLGAEKLIATINALQGEAINGHILGAFDKAYCGPEPELPRGTLRSSAQDKWFRSKFWTLTFAFVKGQAFATPTFTY